MINPLKASTLRDADMKPRITLGPDDLPIAVTGERVLIKPNPPDEQTEGGLHLPAIAQSKPFSGRLMDAGLDALDKLYDAGIEIGDEVWWGKFSGVIEAWDHIVTLGKPDCTHSWARMATPKHATDAFQCSCGAIRWIEPVIVANADDIIGSVELARRRAEGKAVYQRGKSADGRTTHYIEVNNGNA